MLFAQSRSFFPEHDHFPSPVKLNHGRVTGIPREIKQLPNRRRLANAACGGRHENSTHVGHTCRRAGSGSQAEPLELVRTAVRRWAVSCI